MPTETGYCGVSDNDDDPEHCFCDKDCPTCSVSSGVTTENYETLCQSHCDDDSDCLGYDYYFYSKDFFYCTLTTVSPCPTGCRKYSEGNVGDIVNKPWPGISGCYIKLGNARECRI